MFSSKKRQFHRPQVEEGDRPRGFEYLEPAVGCAPGDAWVGLDLGADNAVEKVRWRQRHGLMSLA